MTFGNVGFLCVGLLRVLVFGGYRFYWYDGPMGVCLRVSVFENFSVLVISLYCVSVFWLPVEGGEFKKCKMRLFACIQTGI